MFDVIGGAPLLGPLARATVSGSLPADWNLAVPHSAAGWKERLQHTAASSGTGWLDDLADAFGARGNALARLQRVASAGGVVITTGQQPGLFGGPLYTWSKALTALALADVLEEATGIAAAPVFWAATDDSDFSEASWTAVAERGGSRILRLSGRPEDGTPMSLVEAGDCRGLLSELEKLSYPVVYQEYLSAARAAYTTAATVGDAYVSLLRQVLEPLGIAVLDASHSTVEARSRPLLERAIEHASEVDAAIAVRNAELRARGFEPQVREVDGLSLVFGREGRVRSRLPIGESSTILPSTVLTPNVLLRPVVERFILPAAVYAGGPAEVAYFAQSTAVARALHTASPLAVPRFSATIVEEHVRRLMNKLNVTTSHLADAHQTLARLVRDRVDPEIVEAINSLRRETDAAFSRVEELGSGGDSPLFQRKEVVAGARVSVLQRIARFERRMIAAAKRRETQIVDDFATARGAIFPAGKPQERALNILPLLSRHGPELLESILSGARGHAGGIVYGADGVA